MDLHHQPPGSEPGALSVELQAKLDPPIGVAPISRRYQRFGGIIEMDARPGLAPGKFGFADRRLDYFTLRAF